MVTFSCRVCMFVGAAVSAIACVASAYADDINTLIITFGVIGGIGFMRFVYKREVVIFTEQK